MFSRWVSSGTSIRTAGESHRLGEGSAKKEAFLTALLEGAHNEGEIPSNITNLK